ncbi:MAG TPA: HAMP domain-containing protein, partial [Gemmatimonadales bacterium]|nr:HAMP domain-containing protein [Gemmatimonadales bacterium]
MSFRARLFLAFTVAVLLPLLLLAWGGRREIEQRLAAEDRARGEAATASLEAEVAASGVAVADRLAALAEELAGDNRFRLSVRGDPAARRARLDWGIEAARLSGLALLEVHDDGGHILTSGHFRNEYGRRRPELPRVLTAAGTTPVLVRARTADGSLIALSRVDSLLVAGERFTIAGGVPLDDAALDRLSADPRLALRLALPGAPPGLARGESVVGEVAIPFLDLEKAGTAAEPARLVVVRSDAAIAGLRRSLSVWVAAALAGAAALGLGVAAWLATRVSRPLRELAERTEAIDLDRLDQDFTSDRSDEVGSLSRVLGTMTARLRAGTARLREAERRAAMGDLAR